VLPASSLATALAILASSLTFSLVHYYEGLAGVISNFVAAVILGSLYALRRRTLGSNVIAHSLADSVGLFAIYFGWVS
jgi:membrane protease YdiL (CAAX protease family)